MNIIACCKFVPDVQDMTIQEDRGVNFDRAKWEISEFDLQAVEAGVQLARATEGKLVAVSAGSNRIDSTQLRKDLLSRGPEELTLICDEELADADSFQVGKLLAAQIAGMDADVVLCGEGSADLYNQQTAVQVAAELGWNVICGVDAIEPCDGGVTVKRILEGSIQTIHASCPVVLGVTSSINTPPLPNMKMLLNAGKKPVTKAEASALGGVAAATLSVEETLAVDDPDRKRIVIKGEDLDQAMSELVGYLKSDNVL